MIDLNCNRNRFFIFLLNFFFLQKTQVAREWLTQQYFFFLIFFLKKRSGMTVTH